MNKHGKALWKGSVLENLAVERCEGRSVPAVGLAQKLCICRLCLYCAVGVDVSFSSAICCWILGIFGGVLRKVIIPTLKDSVVFLQRAQGWRSAYRGSCTRMPGCEERVPASSYGYILGKYSSRIRDTRRRGSAGLKCVSWHSSRRATYARTEHGTGGHRQRNPGGVRPAQAAPLGMWRGATPHHTPLIDPPNPPRSPARAPLPAAPPRHATPRHASATPSATPRATPCATPRAALRRRPSRCVERDADEGRSTPANEKAQQERERLGNERP
eukprot:scaffold299_cov343-Prasinococcus_capsulatus_cf.AAC.10